MSVDPCVSVVILSYNRRDELARTLTALHENHDGILETIVVDNASHDGSAEMVLREFPEVRLIQLDANIGIAGWNKGFDVARGEYVLVLDDDSRPLGDAVQRCMRMLRARQDCGIVACAIVDGKGRQSATLSYREGKVVNFVGCGALIRKKVINDLGGFDPNIFLYGHEMEFSLRVLDAGYVILYAPFAQVHHSESGQNRDFRGRVSRRMIRYGNRSTVYLLASRFPLAETGFRLIRIILGRLLFAAFHGAGLTAIRGMLEGLVMARSYRKAGRLIEEPVRMVYAYGAFEGGFFGPAGLAWNNPFRRKVQQSAGL